MRLTVKHQTIYRYSLPLLRSVQSIRLTPRSDGRQQVLKWRLDLPAAAPEFSDAYGNVTQLLTIEGPHDEIRIGVEGVVEVAEDDRSGPESETLPPMVFLRETPLTAADLRLSEFSKALTARVASDPVPALHALMERIRTAVRYVQGTTGVQTTAAEVLSQGSGVCQDHSHLFIACCRTLGIPARYVSGYLHSGKGANSEVATHAWAEAWVDRLGWLSFDISNGQQAGPGHLRLAVGRDYLEAGPLRGVRFGGGAETMEVRVQVMGAQQ
jgi:transglutaminase-like putative cysteine protease